MKKTVLYIIFLFSVNINCRAGEIINYADLARYYIVLVGENHGIAKSYDVELEMFEYVYKNQAIKHLFIEVGYCSSQLLNRYIQTGNSMYLNTVFSNLQGTSGCSIEYYNFFIKLREKCPEVILHGVDVEHQWQSLGISYLFLLLSEHEKIEHIPLWSVPGNLDGFLRYYENNKDNYTVLGDDLEEFDRGIVAVRQGIAYTTNGDQHAAAKYREETMTFNFENEYSKLSHKKVFGIFGVAHTGLDDNGFSGNYSCMAKSLKEKYGDIIASIDLVYNNCRIMNTNFWFGELIRNTNTRPNQSAQYYRTIQDSPAAVHWRF
ncbi:MAG: hypothetical protein LBP19_01100 [Treponema sp.]|nr:hypothetical protein [Treponema sp.]